MKNIHNKELVGNTEIINSFEKKAKLCCQQVYDAFIRHRDLPERKAQVNTSYFKGEYVENF